MRLLLDAHISARRIATALRRDGHDVRSVDGDRSLEGWADEDLLALARVERRILVTFDVKDFPGIVQRWSEAQRTHGGCMILVGIDHGEFGTILSVIARELERRPDAADWADYAVLAGR